MEPTAPPPHTTSSSAAASFAGPSGSSSSTIPISPSAVQSHSHRRSSLYPPPMPGRASSLGAAGGSRGPRATASLYDELCSLRRSSAESIAQMGAMVEARRAAAEMAGQPRPLHLHGGPSSSGLPPLLAGAAFHAPSSFTHLPPSGGFSGPSSSWQQLAWPSSSSAVPDLPGRSFSGYAPPLSQLPCFTRAGQPDLLHGPSSSVQPSGGSFFGNASSSSLLHQQAASSSSMASSFAAFAQPSSSWASTGFAQQQPSSSSEEQYELPPLPPSLRMPLPPVKQEPFHSSGCILPELICIDEEISAGLDYLMHSFDESSQTPGLHDLALVESSSSRDLDKKLQLGGISSRGKNKMPSWTSHSSSIETSITVPKLMLGGMESPRLLPPLPPSRAAGASSSSTSRTGDTDGDLFTDAEMETIQKDERLKQLVDTNPKRVKRILSNRAATARAKAKKAKSVRDLERQFEALQIENVYLTTEVTSEQAKLVQLKAENTEMKLRLQQLEFQSKMNEVQNEALRAEIESLNHIDLSGLYSSGVPIPMSTPIEDEISWYTNATQFPGP